MMYEATGYDNLPQIHKNNAMLQKCYKSAEIAYMASFNLVICAYIKFYGKL